MTTSDVLFPALALGGAVGAMVGWALNDGATFMAIGFIGGIGAAAVALAPRR
jgi:uncharacterized membrane protein